MRVLLIAPASGPWRHVGRSGLFNGKTFRFSLLSLLSVAAASPAGTEITLVDEQVEPVPWDAEVDLVGITAMTALAPRAYEIAARFRARGIPVVLGGMHASFLPEEALAHVDAVCAGEVEGVWATILDDARRGRLSGVYRAASAPSLEHLATPRRELLDAERYATVQAVQATRGCPHACGFCAISAFCGAEQRQRPVAEVAAEIAGLPRPFFLFTDDNLAADPDYARALFEALRPLGKRWVSQSTLRITDDPELVRLAAASGCVGLFVGLETFDESKLQAAHKDMHRAAEYAERLALLHAHGIGVEAGIVLGFDGDGPEVFGSTLRQLDELGLDAIQVSILTPLPGTRMYEEYRPRLRERDWSRYDFHHVVFEPKGLSARELQAGHDWLTREFYRPHRIARRLARIARRPGGLRVLPYAAALNAAYYGRVRRWGFRGWDPAAVREREATHALVDC